MRSISVFALATAAAIFSQSVIAEYKTESAHNKNYRCIADEAGGFNHSQKGHTLTRFKEMDEYFLTHISRLPLPAIKQMRVKAIVDSFKNNEDLLRMDVERAYMKRETIGEDLFQEDNSYYIRAADEDPLGAPNLFSNCTAYGDKKGASQIVCKLFNGNFDFDVQSGRFVYSSNGTWHSNNKKDYAGDSSYFAFGMCKEYYN